MAHELTIRDGKAEMAYVGDTPWHGLGQRLERGAAIEQWQQAAGMGWQILESGVTYDATFKGMKISAKVPDKKVLYRSDSLAPLGVVGDGFNVVQPGEVLEFFRDLTANAGFTLETAGTLFGGRRFWALANIGDECDVVPGDKVGGYLLLCTGADGTLATTGKFTTVRVVCNNTLSMSLNKMGEQKVTHRTTFDPTRMKSQLGIAHAAFAGFTDNARRLADKTVSRDRSEALTLALLRPADFEARSNEERLKVFDMIEKSAGFETILSLFNGKGRGATIDGVAGTAWGYVNAVTEYVDHEKRAKSQDHRIDSAFFGKGDEIKTRAMELALAF